MKVEEGMLNNHMLRRIIKPSRRNFNDYGWRKDTPNFAQY
jgi:hypothetical protein